jgi:hypothetical protein
VRSPSSIYKFENFRRRQLPNRCFFADPTALLNVVDSEARPGSGQRELIERGREIGEELGAEASDKVKATLMALSCQVTIHSDRIEIGISRDRIARMLEGQSIDLDSATQDQSSQGEPQDIVSLKLPVCALVVR